MAYPYLRIKQPQARLMLNYLDIVVLAKGVLGVKKKFASCPKGIWTLRELTYKKLKQMNAVGGSWRL